MSEEDGIVDLQSDKTRLTLHLLRDLLQDSQDISTTDESIQKHILSLNLLLLKGPEPTFMNITWEKLEKAGVRKGFLKFYEDKLASLEFPVTKAASEDAVGRLQSRIEKIFSYVCKKYYPFGCRMVLDEILFALAEISSFESPETGNRSVAILGKTKLTSREDQIKLVNPDSGYELGLSNEVDYVLVEYHDDKKTNFPRQFLLQPEAHRHIYAGSSCMLVVESWNEENDPTSHSPRAVAQAIALIQTQKKLSEVRFCLSTGLEWIFCVLKKTEDDILEYYESARFGIDCSSLHDEISKKLLMLCEWLKPTRTDLFWTQLSDVES